MKKIYRTTGFGTHRHSTHVCPECRFTAKSAMLCPTCGRNMLCIGERWRVPKKTNANGWRLLLKRMFPREVFPRDKTAVVVDNGTYTDFKASVHGYLELNAYGGTIVPRGT